MQVLDLARRRCDELETRNNFFSWGRGGGGVEDLGGDLMVFRGKGGDQSPPTGYRQRP